MLKSFDEMTPDQQLAYKMGYEAARSELPVAGPDDLVIRREDFGAVIEVVTKAGSYGVAPIIQQSDWAFTDLDHEIGTDLAPGRYLILPVAAAEGGEEE